MRDRDASGGALLIRSDDDPRKGIALGRLSVKSNSRISTVIVKETIAAGAELVEGGLVKAFLPPDYTQKGSPTESGLPGGDLWT
jgi:hypothetical protein